MIVCLWSWKWCASKVAGHVAVEEGGDDFFAELGELTASLRLVAFHTMCGSIRDAGMNYVASEIGQRDTESTVMKPMRW